MAYTEGHEMDWDSVIENDGEEFPLLAEGDYNFEVTKFERDRSSGNGKLPSCPMAVITMRITDPQTGASTSVTDNLILHSSMEWKLAQFFRAIGQKKHGEPLRPNWQAVVGGRGRCHIYVDKYDGKNGTVERNKVNKYYDPDGSSAASAPAPSSSVPKKNFWG